MMLNLPRYLKSVAGRRLKRILFRSTSAADFILASNRYGVYCIPASHSHRPAARDLMAGGVWEAETTEFIAEHCSGGDVVTAGAWAGDALPALSMATSPHHSVWAFEPNPESFRCCAVTVLLNNLKNVKLVNAALGELMDTKHLIVRDFCGQALGGASQIVDVCDSNGNRGTEAVAVEVVTIDDVVPTTATVSVIQLDIEGFEEFALAGAVKTITRNRPLLILETVPAATSPAGRFLESSGYRVSRRLDSENVLLECDGDRG
jgi:FkbM family methyltransferase